jgi:hypothetical protein
MVMSLFFVARNTLDASVLSNFEFVFVSERMMFVVAVSISVPSPTRCAASHAMLALRMHRIVGSSEDRGGDMRMLRPCIRIANLVDADGFIIRLVSPVVSDSRPLSIACLHFFLVAELIGWFSTNVRREGSSRYCDIL